MVRPLACQTVNEHELGFILFFCPFDDDVAISYDHDLERARLCVLLHHREERGEGHNVVSNAIPVV